MLRVYRNRPTDDQYRIVFGRRTLRGPGGTIRIWFTGPIVFWFGSR